MIKLTRKAGKGGAKLGELAPVDRTRRRDSHNLASTLISQLSIIRHTSQGKVKSGYGHGVKNWAAWGRKDDFVAWLPLRLGLDA